MISSPSKHVAQRLSSVAAHHRVTPAPQCLPRNPLAAARSSSAVFIPPSRASCRRSCSASGAVAHPPRACQQRRIALDTAPPTGCSSSWRTPSPLGFGRSRFDWGDRLWKALRPQPRSHATDRRRKPPSLTSGRVQQVPRSCAEAAGADARKLSITARIESRADGGRAQPAARQRRKHTRGQTERLAGFRALEVGNATQSFIEG